MELVFCRPEPGCAHGARTSLDLQVSPASARVSGAGTGELGLKGGTQSLESWLPAVLLPGASGY